MAKIKQLWFNSGYAEGEIFFFCGRLHSPMNTEKENLGTFYVTPFNKFSFSSSLFPPFPLLCNTCHFLLFFPLFLPLVFIKSLFLAGLFFKTHSSSSDSRKRQEVVEWCLFLSHLNKQILSGDIDPFGITHGLWPTARIRKSRGFCRFGLEQDFGPQFLTPLNPFVQYTHCNGMQQPRLMLISVFKCVPSKNVALGNAPGIYDFTL